MFLHDSKEVIMERKNQISTKDNLDITKLGVMKQDFFLEKIPYKKSTN